jgi:hypothetical protein
MLRFFKRKQPAATPMDTVWEKLNTRIKYRQSKWAGYLQQKSSGFTPRKWKILLGGFCLVFASSSTYVIVHALQGKSGFTKPAEISIPKHVDETGSLEKERKELETGPEYRAIERFLQHMDSLKATLAGRRQYDSFMHARPGLMDSIRFIEKIHKPF